MKRNLQGYEGLAGGRASAALHVLAVGPATACAARLASAPSPSQRGSRGLLRQAPRILERRQDGGALGRLFAGGVIFLGLLVGTPRCPGADLWGGSLGITSDYFVRGISRSNDHAALQLDLHYVNTAGFVAGLFASNTQIDPGEPRDVGAQCLPRLRLVCRRRLARQGPRQPLQLPVESDGLAIQLRRNRSRRRLSWVARSSRSAYSPDSPRYLPYRGFIGVTAESAEVRLAAAGARVSCPVRRVSAITTLDGPDATGYAYWSVGAAYDWAPVSLAVSYVGTTAAG